MVVFAAEARKTMVVATSSGVARRRPVLACGRDRRLRRGERPFHVGAQVSAEVLEGIRVEVRIVVRLWCRPLQGVVDQYVAPTPSVEDGGDRGADRVLRPEIEGYDELVWSVRAPRQLAALQRNINRLDEQSP